MIAQSGSTLPSPLDQLATRATRNRVLDAGETLFRQGDSTRGLFYLMTGVIELRRITEAGHAALMFRATAGNTLAEASLFHNHYHCTAIATARSELVECSREAILERYETDVKFALAMSKRLATQVQQTRMRLELLSIRSAEERVYRAVVEGLLCDSAKSLANEIGLSAEAVYRALSVLSSKGRIRKLRYGCYAAV